MNTEGNPCGMKYLLITANFAPRGASPALRTVHLSKYLSVLAYEVHVLTYDEETLTLFSDADNALSHKVPGEVNVTRIQPGPIRRLLSKGNKDGQVRKSKKKLISNPITQLLIPDPHVDSIPAFYKAAKAMIQVERPDVIITFGYPYSMHIVGAMLRRKFRDIFWIADYGDPWAGTPVTEMPRPAWRRWLDKRLEASCLRWTDLVTLTTTPTLDLYEAEFPFLKGKTATVEMGYDPDDFAAIAPMTRPAEMENKTVFLHAGRVYPAARDPKPFIDAVVQLKHNRPDLYSLLQVILLGETDSEVLDLIRNSGAEQAFHIIDWVPMADSIAWMKAADQLLLFGNKGGIQVPGKVYQYVGSGQPVFMTCESIDDPTVSVLQHVNNATIAENVAFTIQSHLVSILGGKADTRSEGKEQGSRFSWPEISDRLNMRAQGMIEIKSARGDVE